MRPFLFHIGSLGIPSFFFMVMIGSLAATFYIAHKAKLEKADPVAMLDFGIIAIIASVVGSRVFHILIEAPAYYWEKPLRVFYFWQGGFVSLGAFVFSLAGWLIYLWRRKLPTFRYLDIAATGVPIAIFFVRCGCLLVGCCYGKPTDFFIHLIFNDPASTAGYLHPGVALHATQIYFMLNAIVMWVLLLLVYKYRKFYGQVLAAFFLYEGFSRFLIEFLRGDADRGLWFGGALSSGQVAMIASFISGLAIWTYCRRSKLSS